MAKFTFFSTLIFLSSFVNAQLSGPVGPLTNFTTKAQNKICDVTDYGAVSDNETDIGPALSDAWDDCKNGGLVYIPPGEYAMQTWITLKHGNGTAIQLDGTIIRDNDDGGTMITIRDATDFEFFSGTSEGAFQGYGYKLLQDGTYGARFVRLQDVSNFSVHGFALVDSASYYFVFAECSNGEIYNLIIRGIDIGMTDGIDIWGTNIWVHDVEVTNGDECVTVKSPSKNIKIESIHCNISGGTAIGSLGLNTNISNVHYQNLYMNQADACYLKTNNGNGTVSDIVWEDVIVHGGAYILAINEGWGSDRGGEGVEVSNLTFKNWHGYNSASSRPTIRLDCDPDVPCHDIVLQNVNLWTGDADADSVTWSCQNAYGEGACLRDANGTSAAELATYTTKVTVTATPSYNATTMPNDLASAFPSNASFTIPPVPTTFYPGLQPSSSLLALAGPGGVATTGAAAATAKE